MGAKGEAGMLERGVSGLTVEGMRRAGRVEWREKEWWEWVEGRMVRKGLLC